MFNNSEERKKIFNNNEILKNFTLSTEQCDFSVMREEERLPFDINEKGESTYYLNTTSHPLSVINREGVTQIIGIDKQTVLDRWHTYDLRTLHPNSLIIVKTVANNINAVSPSMRSDAKLEDYARDTKYLLEFRKDLTDYEKVYAPIKQALSKAVNIQCNFFNGGLNQPGFHEDGNIGVLVNCIVCVVPEKHLFDDKGTYVESADIVARKESYVDDGYGYDIIRQNKRTVYHPLSIEGGTLCSEGGVLAEDNHATFESIQVVSHTTLTPDNCLYLARFSRIEKIRVKYDPNPNNDGIYITRKGTNGSIEKVRDSLTSMKAHGIFNSELEATGAHQEFNRRYLDEETRRLEIERQRLEKEAEEKERQRKNDQQRRYDAYKLVGQVVTTVAAIVGAVVTLIKIFRPSSYQAKAI